MSLNVPWMDDMLVPQTIVIDGKEYELEFREYTELQRQAHYDFVYRQLWEEINDGARWWVFLNTIMRALQNDSNLVFQFHGKSASGKSWLAIARALEVKWLEEVHYGYEDVHIHYVFNLSEIARLLSNAYKPDVPRSEKALAGDIILTDEISNLSGAGSLNAEGALSNILRACRILKVHFFFSDPEVKPLPNVDYLFRVCAIAKEAFVTLSIIESAENHPIGFDIFEIPVNTEEWKQEIARYTPLKLANVETLTEGMGYVGVDVSQDQMEEATALMEWGDKLEGTGVRVTREQLKLGAMDIGFHKKGVGYADNVITRVMLWRKQRSGSGGGRELSPYAGQVDVIQEALYERLIERGIAEKKVDILRMYCDGIGQDAIKVKHNMGQSNVSKIIKQVGEYQLGYAWEDVYSALLTRDGVKHRMGGSNTDEPDVVLLGDDGEPIEVISLKAYNNKRGVVTIPFTAIAVKELEMRDEYGIPLYLLFYDIKNKILHKKVLVTDQEKFSFTV